MLVVTVSTIPVMVNCFSCDLFYLFSFGSKHIIKIYGAIIDHNTAVIHNFFTTYGAIISYNTEIFMRLP